PQFDEAGATIVGISFDTPEENKAFADSQSFPYRLLSDVDRNVGEAYGAKKAADDKWPDFAKRNTYLIDPEGTVRKTYEVTDVAAHPDEVLEDIRSFSGATA